MYNIVKMMIIGLAIFLEQFVGAGNHTHAGLSRVYANRFVPQMVESATLGQPGFLDMTFNPMAQSPGSMNVSSQLGLFNSIAQSVATLSNDACLVGISDDAGVTKLGMYTTQGNLQLAYGQQGVINLGENAPMIRSITLDVQERAIVTGGDGTASSGWMIRVSADGNDKAIFVPSGQHTWSMITGAYTESTGNIIAIGSNGTHGMLARYLVNGGIDHSFGVNGFVVFDNQNGLPLAINGIFTIVIDENNNLYVPCVDQNYHVSIARLTPNGQLDTHWLRHSYQGVVTIRVAPHILFGTLTPTDATHATFVSRTPIAYYNNIATFSYPVYTGNLNITANNAGIFHLYQGAFSFLNTVPIDYIFGAMPDQIRIAQDTQHNLIIAAQVDGAIMVTGIQMSNGNALSNFTDFSSKQLVTTDSLSIAGVIISEDNSIVVGCTDSSLHRCGLIKLQGVQAIAPGTLDSSFYQQGFIFFTTNVGATNLLYDLKLLHDGRLYVTSGQTFAERTEAYLSRLYNSLYTGSVPQFPSTVEPGVINNGWASASRLMYQGFIMPYCGLYKGNLYQKIKKIVELVYSLSPNSSLGLFDFVAIGDGSTDQSAQSSMILTWLTSSGDLDTTISNEPAGQLILNNEAHQFEYAATVAQDAQGDLYVAGFCQAGVILRKYSSESTQNWNRANSVWAQLFDRQAQGSVPTALALPGNQMVYVTAYDKQNAGFITVFDQMTGLLANGENETPVFGDQGSGSILYNSFGLAMGIIAGIVINNMGNFFVAYQDFNTGYVNVAGFKPDGSGLIEQFGVNGVVYNIFPTASVDAFNILIAKTAYGNLIISAADSSHVYLAMIDGVNGHLDKIFNNRNNSYGTMSFALNNPNVYSLQGVSDGSILVGGSCDNQHQMFVVRVTFDGVIDQSFNYQGLQPGYQFIQPPFDSITNVATTLAVQSQSGAIVSAGYATLTDLDATPVVMQSYGASGTHGVGNFNSMPQYPGTLDDSLDGTGIANLAVQLGAPSGDFKVYAYPQTTAYQGMLLLGFENIVTSMIARVDSTYIALDKSFGKNGIYELTPIPFFIEGLLVDASENIIVTGTSGNQGMAWQINPDGQSAIEFAIPSNIIHIAGVGQQASGRYILACTTNMNQNQILAFENKLTFGQTQLQLDPTFNPLQSAGSYTIPHFFGGLASFLIDTDDAIIVANQSDTVVLTKILNNGSGLDMTFGTAGNLVTELRSTSLATIQLVFDMYHNIIVAVSNSDQRQLELIRYMPSGLVDNSWIGTQGYGTIRFINLPYLSNLTLTGCAESVENQTILVGYSDFFAPSDHGNLFAIRLNSQGQLDTKWNPYPTGFNVPGILTYGAGQADYTGNCCIGDNGSIWIGGAYFNLQSISSVLIKIIGDPYVGQAPQYPLASAAGTLDYTIASVGAVDLQNQFGISVGTPVKLALLSNQAMLMATEYNRAAQIIKINQIQQLDTTFNMDQTAGFVTLDQVDKISDLFVAQAAGQDGSIYVTGGYGLDTPSLFAACIASDGSTITRLTALTNMTTGTAIRLSMTGQILVAGYDFKASCGAIIACNKDLTQIDTNFGTNGSYLTGVNSSIMAMTVDPIGRIYLAFEDIYIDDNENQYYLICLQRLLPDGYTLDKTFGTNGQISALTSYVPFAPHQIFMQLDSNNQQIVVAGALQGQRVFSIARYSTIDGSGTGGLQFEPNGTVDNSMLSNMFIDSAQHIYLIGYLGSPDYQTMVARMRSIQDRAFSLDVTYAADSPTPGIAKVIAGPLTRSLTRVNGVAFKIGDGVLDQDGRVYIVGQSGTYTPYMARLFGDNYDQIIEPSVQFLPIEPSHLNRRFGLDGAALTSDISNLIAGGQTIVDSQGRIIIAGRTVDQTSFVAFRFFSNGILDTSFNAQTPVFDTIITGSFVAIDALDNIYVAGLSNQQACVVAKFLAVDGSLDISFNSSGFLTHMPGISQSYSIEGLRSLGGIAINSIGNIIIAAATLDMSIVVAQFLPSGQIDINFGSVIPGISQTQPFTNLVQLGTIVVEKQAEVPAIFVGAMTLDDRLWAIKFDSNGNIDTVYGNHGIAQSAIISGLISGGPIALDVDQKLLIAGSTSNQQFVVNRYNHAGQIDTLFGSEGLAYSPITTNLAACHTITLDTNNNIVMSGVSLLYSQLLVARLTQGGIVDTTFGVLGIAATNSMYGLVNGGYGVVNQLNNPMVGGYADNKLLIVQFYSGAEIFVNDPEKLSCLAFPIYWYGNNPALFENYLAVNYYAQAVTDFVARYGLIQAVENSLKDYCAIYQNQPNLNLAASTSPGWDGYFHRLQQDLQFAYPDSRDDINRFFINFNNRRQQLHQLLAKKNN